MTPSKGPPKAGQGEPPDYHHQGTLAPVVALNEVKWVETWYVTSLHGAEVGILRCFFDRLRMAATSENPPRSHPELVDESRCFSLSERRNHSMGRLRMEALGFAIHEQSTDSGNGLEPIAPSRLCGL